MGLSDSETKILAALLDLQAKQELSTTEAATRDSLLERSSNRRSYADTVKSDVGKGKGKGKGKVTGKGKGKGKSPAGEPDKSTGTAKRYKGPGAGSLDEAELSREVAVRSADDWGMQRNDQNLTRLPSSGAEGLDGETPGYVLTT